MRIPPPFKIFAKVEAADTYGYSVYDWFEGNVLDREFATRQAAEQTARDAYKGPDVDGIECSWEIA